MLFEKYDVSKRILDFFTENQVAGDGGTYTRNQLEDDFSALSLSGRIQLIVSVLNNLDSLDPFISQMTQMTDKPTIEEIWVDGDWHESNPLARGDEGTYYKRQLSIANKGYDFGLNVSKMQVMRANSQANMGGRRNSSFMAISMMLERAVTSYDKLLRKLALQALFANPSSEDKSLPVLYRDTTAYAAANQVIPPKNGFLSFEDSAGQEHHLASSGVSAGLLTSLRKLVTNKGGDSSSVVIFACESEWEKLRAQYTTDDLDKLQLITDLGADNIFKSPLTSTFNLVLDDSDMPEYYWGCVDLSKKLLAKTEPFEKELKGIHTTFDTLSDIMREQGVNENSTAEEVERVTRMADNRFKSSTINGEIKLEVYNLGFGVVMPGMGAVAYTGGETYVAPDFSF